MEVLLRPIEERDNQNLAAIVKSTLAEFGANHPNTVYDDPRTDHLYEEFRHPRSSYFIAEVDNKMVGGGGIFPTEGLPTDTCELVKMYLLPEARGLGIGKTLIEKNVEKARELGYRQIYLESMPELRKALNIYEKFGWQYLKGPMGNSGHKGCSLWMIKSIVQDISTS